MLSEQAQRVLGFIGGLLDHGMTMSPLDVAHAWNASHRWQLCDDETTKLIRGCVVAGLLLYEPDGTVIVRSTVSPDFRSSMSSGLMVSGRLLAYSYLATRRRLRRWNAVLRRRSYI